MIAVSLMELMRPGMVWPKPAIFRSELEGRDDLYLNCAMSGATLIYLKRPGRGADQNLQFLVPI
jgi:hypothetical protein